MHTPGIRPGNTDHTLRKLLQVGRLSTVGVALM